MNGSAIELVSILAFSLGSIVCSTVARAGGVGSQTPTTQPYVKFGTLDGPSDGAMAFSRDGTRLVTAGSRSCRVWDTRMLRPLTAALEHGDVVSDVGIDRAGKRVMMCGAVMESRDGHGHWRGTGATVWSVATSRRLFDLPDHGAGHPVWHATLSPDGTQLATCAEGDANVRVWDAVTSEPLFRLTMDGEVAFVIYDPTGRRLLACELGVARARQFDLKTRQPVGDVLPADADRYRGVTRPACYSTDGNLLALTNIDRLYVYDAERGVEISHVGEENQISSRGIFTSVDLSADGRVMAGTAPGYGSRAWDARTCEPLTDTFTTIGAPAAISPDGKLLACGMIDDQVPTLWDATTGQPVQRLLGLESYEQFRFSPDGRLLAVASGLRGETVLLKRAPGGKGHTRAHGYDARDSNVR